MNKFLNYVLQHNRTGEWLYFDAYDRPVSVQSLQQAYVFGFGERMKKPPGKYPDYKRVPVRTVTTIELRVD